MKEFNFGEPKPADIIPWESASASEYIVGSEWLNPVGPLDEVGNYEQQQLEKGEPLDIFKMIELSNARVLHLEKIQLENGIRYVTIKDEDGTEVYSDTQYDGFFACDCEEQHPKPNVTIASNIMGTDLGDGYTLKLASANLARSHKSMVYEAGEPPREIVNQFGDHIRSYVAKERIDTAGGKHLFKYNISSQEQDFSCDYQYLNDEESEAIRYRDGKLPIILSLVDNKSRDQLDINFATDGSIDSIVVGGKYLQNDPEAQSEMLALSADTQRNIRRIEREDIDSPMARSLIASVLGIDQIANRLVRDIRIDFPATIASMVANMDSDSTARPSTLLKVA